MSTKFDISCISVLARKWVFSARLKIAAVLIHRMDNAPAPAHQSINEKLKQWKTVNTNSEKTSITTDRKSRNQIVSRNISTSDPSKEHSWSVCAPVGDSNVRYFNRGNGQILQTASRPTSSFFIPSNELNLSNDKISSRSNSAAVQSKSNPNVPSQTRRILTDNNHAVTLNSLDSSLRLSGETGSNFRTIRNQPNSDCRDSISRGRVPGKTSTTKIVTDIKTKSSANTLTEDTSAMRSSPNRERIRNTSASRPTLAPQPSRLKLSKSMMINPESAINSPGHAVSQPIFLEKNNMSDGECSHIIESSLSLSKEIKYIIFYANYDRCCNRNDNHNVNYDYYNNRNNKNDY